MSARLGSGNGTTTNSDVPMGDRRQRRGRRRDWDRIEELCAPGYVHHAPKVGAADVHAYLQTAPWPMSRPRRATSPEAPTGPRSPAFRPQAAPVSFSALGLMHIRDGRLTEGWLEFDTGAIVDQLTAATVPSDIEQG